MANKNGPSGRRRSRRLAKASTNLREAETQAPSSPETPSAPSPDYELAAAGSIDFSPPDEPFVAEPNDENSSDSPDITPPPAWPKAKRSAPSITLSDDSDADDQPPAKKAQLLLHIPRASEVGNQRVEFTHATSYDDALDIIYESVGCADVARKPVLAYKLASAPKGSAMTLNSETDWTGCLEDVRQAEDAKKAGTLIPVHILVTDQYIASLSAKLGKGKGKPMAGKGGRGKPKVPILDLDHAESGDDDFDEDLGSMEKESKFLEQLQNQYGHCQLCGTTKACKITVAGTHHPLSNNQLRAWAQSLTLGKHGVTLKTPPRAVGGQNLFGMFFKTMHSSEAPSTPQMQPQFSGMPPFMMNPYAFMSPWGMPGPGANGHPQMPVMPHPMSTPFSHANAEGASASVPRASTSALPADLPSSDPPDMGTVNPYPEITGFLQQLDTHQPNRRLLSYIPTFEELDFYNIDELMKLGGTAEELVRVAGISLGNATFIMTQIKGEMKRIDRARRS
ncbi:hypothetical protein FB451DRAFT_1412712 [Mycena latifolia]|nr:hypothetical protein FB451DRAFT_1412712 [Mycena latifolia]